jgi:hypothetical protein
MVNRMPADSCWTKEVVGASANQFITDNCFDRMNRMDRMREWKVKSDSYILVAPGFG